MCNSIHVQEDPLPSRYQEMVQRREPFLARLKQYMTFMILLLVLESAMALPQPAIIATAATTKPHIFHKTASNSVLYLSKSIGISPLAVCTGTASFISGFDVGIIAGALLLLAPEFGLAETPHRCDVVD